MIVAWWFACALQLTIDRSISVYSRTPSINTQCWLMTINTDQKCVIDPNAAQFRLTGIERYFREMPEFLFALINIDQHRALIEGVLIILSEYPKTVLQKKYFGFFFASWSPAHLTHLQWQVKVNFFTVPFVLGCPELSKRIWHWKVTVSRSNKHRPNLSGKIRHLYLQNCSN